MTRFFLLITFIFIATSCAQQNSVKSESLNPTNKIHQKYLGDWYIDLTLTIDSEKKNNILSGHHIQNLNKDLPILSKSTMNLSENELKLNIYGNAFQMKIRSFDTSPKEMKFKGEGSILTGIRLINNDNAQIITESIKTGSLIWKRTKNDPDKIKTEIKKLVDKYSQDEVITANPIPLVRYEKYDELVKLLKEKPNAAKFKDSISSTALHDACRLKLVKYVKLLLEHGADPNALTNKGNSESPPIHNAIRFNKESKDSAIEIIKLLLKSGANINIPDSNGQSVLLKSTDQVFINGDISFIMFLIENKADLFQKDNYGNYPFGILCKTDKTPESFFKYLEENKIKFNWDIVKYELSIVQIIAEHKQMRTLKLLVKHGYGKDALRRSMMDNLPEFVSYLLSENIQLPDDYDPTRIIKKEFGRRGQRPSRQRWDSKMFCTEDVHHVVKEHLEKLKK